MSIDIEQDRLDDSLKLTLDQWPRLDRMWGCVNCNLVFARPSGEQRVCIGCRSEQVFDVAAVLDKRAASNDTLKTVLHGLEELTIEIDKVLTSEA